MYVIVDENDEIMVYNLMFKKDGNTFYTVYFFLFTNIKLVAEVNEEISKMLFFDRATPHESIRF